MSTSCHQTVAKLSLSCGQAACQNVINNVKNVQCIQNDIKEAELEFWKYGKDTL